MMTGIITSTVVPVRMEPDEWSTMISQALFGEMCVVLQFLDHFVEIKLETDGTTGWVDHKVVAVVDDLASKLLGEAKCHIIQKYNELQFNNSPYTIKLLPGSEIRFSTPGGNTMKLGNDTFVLKQRISTPMYGDTRNAIISKALEFVHAPYMAGGRTSWGIDAPGLTQLVFKLHGIALPRLVSHQMAVGRSLKTIDESLPGDLAFFSGVDGVISHVGIVHENQRLIHAWGEVRIDAFDDKGIFNQRLQAYSHKLLFIKNIID